MTTPHANEHQNSSHRNERMPSWRRLAVIGAISSIALAGCAPADAEPKPVPAPSETVTPIETPTPTPEPTPEAPKLNNDPIPEALAYIENLTPEEVGKLPIEERLAYVSYVTRNIAQFNKEANVYNITEKKYPTEPLSLESDPQDIATSFAYVRLMTLAQSNPEEGKRLLASCLYKGAQSPNYASIVRSIEEDIPFYPLKPSQTSLFATPKVVSVGPIETHSVGVPYREINTVGIDAEGKEMSEPSPAHYLFFEYTDYRGEPKGIWIMQ